MFKGSRKSAQAEQALESRQDATQGRVNNSDFEQHVSSLAPCARPFFNQALQIVPTPASLPHIEAWQIIEEFKHIKTKKLEYIQELVALASIAHAQQYREIINALLDGLEPEKNRLLNLYLLRGLSAVLLQRTKLTQDAHSVGDCTTVLLALLGWLEKIHIDNNLEQVETLLQAFSLVLDRMVSLKVKELDRLTLEQPLKRALNRFDNQKKYPELAWPIQYIRQALARLPNHEGFSEALIRRALPVLGGISYLTTFGLKLVSAEGFIAGFEPDKLWETYKSFKEAFGEIESFKCASWYGELCFIDVLIGMGRFDLFGELLKKNSELREEAYLRGLCDRFERTACLQNKVLRDDALKLLKGFKEGQITWAKHESIQRYASQSLNRLALMWPTPNAEAMEREGYAPFAWHPFWTVPLGTALLRKIQNKVQSQANREVALHQIAEIKDEVQRLLPSPVSLTTLRNAFQRYYDSSDLSLQRVSGEKASLKDCYINLAIVESQAQREKDQEELKKQAAFFKRLPSSEQLEAMNPNKLIRLDQLFETQKLRDGSENVPKRILIQGRAGIGKTTLCKKLVYEYHHNGLWQDHFDCVLWIPLRQLKTHAPKRLEDLLCNQYFVDYESTHALALAKAFQQNHRDRTLFILDGLDEVTEALDKRHLLNLLLENLLNQTHVLITSRPAGVSASQCNELDLELETIGFNADNVRTYIKTFAPKLKRTEIQQFIDRTPLIQGLVNIPIQFDALCYSWDKLPKGQAVTMAMLYQAMVDKLWRKDSVRLEKKENGQLLGTHEIENLSESELEEVMAAEIDYLSYLAFKGLEAEKIEFSRQELSDHKSELNKVSATGRKLPITFTTNLKKTSYLHTADAERPESERYYHFLHLTFQEFFAARYLVQHLQGYSGATDTFAHAELGLMLSQEKLEMFIAAHKYNPRYEIVWWMVAGLLKGAPLEYFFTLLEKVPRDLVGIRHQQIMMGCLNEARVQLDKTRVFELEKTFVQWLRFEIESENSEVSQSGRQMTCPESLLLMCLDQPKNRKNILQTLGARSSLSGDAISALIAALQDEDKIVRYAAARALGKHKARLDPSMSAIITTIQGEGKRVRSTAAWVLGKHKARPDQAMSTIITTTQGEGKRVRSVAAWVLDTQKAMPDKIISDMITVLQNEGTAARSAAASAINYHIYQLYPLLPSLELDQIQTLYSKAFLPKGQQIAALYIQDHSLRFYTAAGLKSIPLEAEQINKLTQAFEAVQAAGGITPWLKE